METLCAVTGAASVGCLFCTVPEAKVENTQSCEGFLSALSWSKWRWQATELEVFCSFSSSAETFRRRPWWRCQPLLGFAQHRHCFGSGCGGAV